MGKKSKTTQERTTDVSTMTTTNIRDIGLTGVHAVDLAAILESGAVEQTQITAGIITNLIQATGAGMQQLIGGATELVQAAEAIAVEKTPFEKLTENVPLIAAVALAALGYKMIVR